VSEEFPVRSAQTIPRAPGWLIGRGNLSTEPQERRFYAKTCVNAVIVRPKSVITPGEAQYAAYYDAQGRVVLAKRKLGSDQWQKRVTQYNGNVRDVLDSEPDFRGRTGASQT
jgi:hypothetical protein